MDSREAPAGEPTPRAGATELLMVTATVPDLAAIAEAWRLGTDYEVVEQQPVPPELEIVWGTTPAAHPAAVVTRAPGSDRGLVRLVAGEGGTASHHVYSFRGPMAIEFFARDAGAVHAGFRGTPF